MFGIIDENKKIILYNENSSDLRTVALLHLKESENGLIPMFDEDTVDEAIKEYADEDIETAYTGEKYLKGFAPKPSNEYQSKEREKAYIAEVDPITSHISRLKDEEQTEEIIAEIEQLKAERTEKRNAIKERFPYYE